MLTNEEEEFLDRLTAHQEVTNPVWDHVSRVLVCRDSLHRGLLAVPKARMAYGDRACCEAFGIMGQSVSDEDLTAAVRDYAAKDPIFGPRDYPDPSTLWDRARDAVVNWLYDRKELKAEFEAAVRRHPTSDERCVIMEWQEKRLYSPGFGLF